MTREEVIGVVSKWQDTFARRDVEAYSRLYAAHAALESPFAGSQRGPDGATRLIKAFVHAFPDATLKSDTPVIDEGRVAVYGTMTGTDTGGLMGLPASHRAFHFPLVFLLEVKDGLIVRDRRIYDFTGFLVQLGVLKAKPA
jgi:steroid delta-isomerase-like uncharacterized protein